MYSDMSQGFYIKPRLILITALQARYIHLTEVEAEAQRNMNLGKVSELRVECSGFVPCCSD